MEESQRIFSKLMRFIEKQSGEVKEVIRAQERAAVSQAEAVLEKIQREMVELRNTSAELERLSHTEDHIHFLQVNMDEFIYLLFVFLTLIHRIEK